MIRKESAHQLFTRLGNQKFGNYGLAVFADHPVTTGHLVEVCSEESVGHGAFLHHVIAHHLVQKRSAAGGVSGSGHVVLLSTRYTVSAAQLRAVLRGRVEAVGADSVADSTRRCLEMVHVLFCDSSAQLLLTLSRLPSLLDQHPRVNLVVIDDIGAYYWSDRYSSESRKLYPDEVARPLSSALANLFADHGLAVVAGKSILYTSKSGEMVEYMPPYWQKMVTHRVVLTNSGCKMSGREIAEKMFFVNLRQQCRPPLPLAANLGAESKRTITNLPSPESVHVVFKCCDLMSKNSGPSYLIQLPTCTGLLNVMYS